MCFVTIMIMNFSWWCMRNVFSLEIPLKFCTVHSITGRKRWVGGGGGGGPHLLPQTAWVRPSLYMPNFRENVANLGLTRKSEINFSRRKWQNTSLFGWKKPLFCLPAKNKNFANEGSPVLRIRKEQFSNSDPESYLNLKLKKLKTLKKYL